MPQINPVSNGGEDRSLSFQAETSQQDAVENLVFVLQKAVFNAGDSW